MNKTRIRISLLVGLSVTITILIVLLIFNIVSISRLEDNAEEAIDEVIAMNLEAIYNDSNDFVYEDETESTYYAQLIYLTNDDGNDNGDDNGYTLTEKEDKIVDYFLDNYSEELQLANIGNAYYYIKSVDLSDDNETLILLAYVNVSGEPELIRTINIYFIFIALLVGIIGSLIGYKLGCKLEENEKSQKQFFENTSHELKTPLMTINGYAEGLETGVVTDYKKVGRIINSQTRRMSGLIEDILYISKVESRMVTLNKEELEVNSYVQDILMPFEGIVISKGINVNINLDEGYINADPDKLEHAISNLITNAIKYADSKIEIAYSSNKLTIWNDGSTLSDEEITHVFDRFYTSSKGNTGIGLALAKEIFKLHGYKVSARNARNGTEFIVIMN